MKQPFLLYNRTQFGSSGAAASEVPIKTFPADPVVSATSGSTATTHLLLFLVFLIVIWFSLPDGISVGGDAFPLRRLGGNNPSYDCFQDARLFDSEH